MSGSRCWARLGLALVLALGCVHFRRLTPADRLLPSEKLHYLILDVLSPEHARTYVSRRTAADRAAYLDRFWADREAEPQGREFYWQRGLEARDFFGQTDLLGDDRVRTYIRFGPAQRRAFEPKQVQTDTLTIFTNPAEIWTYDSLGSQFDFVRKGTGFRLVGRSVYGPNVRVPALEPTGSDAARPVVRSEAQQLGLEFSLSRLEERTDTVEVEFHYGVTLRRLAEASARTEPEPVHLTVEFRGRGRNQTETSSLWAAAANLPETLDSRLAVGRLRFRLHADVYDVRVRAVTASGLAFDDQTRSLNLLDYVRKAQPVSDLVFCSLADSTYQSSQFAVSGWQRLVPLVVPETRPGQAFYILYELYNLATDQDNRHQVEAEYDIIERVSRRLAVIPTPATFVSGTGTQAVVVERVHTMDLIPGSYLLVARVRDLVAERDISLTARFAITP